MAFHVSLRNRAATRTAASPPGPERSVAFVFQGGGSLTAPQVGMVQALTEAAVVPDLVIGSSAGALNAVAFASDPRGGGGGPDTRGHRHRGARGGD